MTAPVRARDDWTLVFEGFDPVDEGRREALCTLGNGYQAVRGAAPESPAGGPHYPGTYAAGFFNRLVDEAGGTVVETESMVNLPNWLPLQVAVAGEWLDPLDPEHLLEHRLTLDMRHGLLDRVLRFTDAAGRRTAVRQRRFVHMGRRHLAGLQTVVTPENWSGRLWLRSGLDGRVTNSGVSRYRDMAGRHLRVARIDEADPETLLLVAGTTQSELLVAEAARTRIDGNGGATARRRTVRERERVFHDVHLEVTEGRALTVEKIVALVTSRDVAISHPALTAVEQLADAPSFQDLLTGHELAWEQLWRRFRVDLTDGRPTTAETLRTLRLGLFHVLQTASPHDLDLDAGIPARGLHGEAYRGHVFWDELFVLPVLTLRMPQLTRALLHYRVRRLDAARHAARRAGHRGAMYPWQSGSDGREESQRVHLNPRSGRWLPDTSELQRHVGLAVAYDIWQYYQATGDLDFLAGHGAEVVLEVARFFADLAQHDPALDRYRIRGVMGPDEYSTRYPGAARPGIDDNAYTNVMAVWVWHRARDTLAVLPSTRRTELVERLGLTPAELLHWEDLCRRTYVPFRADGVLEQFHGASRLPELDWDDYRRRYGDLQRLDRILEAEGRSVDDYQVTKQADALMLFYLLSADELRELLRGLGYALPPDAIPRTIDHHLSRTVHGSTLSALVHAWVLARAHREDALDHFERALRSDLADVQGGTTAEGVHLGAMAGSVDLLQRCFAGLETRADALWFNPHWPERFGALEFGVEYRSLTLDVRVSGREVRVTAAPGPGTPVRVGCGDDVRLLHPGEAHRFVAFSSVSDQSAATDPARIASC
ncbi:glycoside hydrolase family 65 protein [Pseudonocardia sp. RS11V-5]|uniref:glycoside hydrolase family 65 protein n=1 Tax=Pseudonocardia terrae TaxID=2905831 RepID=UPI001E64BB70|nr:glycosyl hydrolase family 65 protein [Pseudonocardia terrae]MCE3553133.1 glycoside hydrolase family 65 protein [Pseudonocardia terrae]